MQRRFRTPLPYFLLALIAVLAVAAVMWFPRSAPVVEPVPVAAVEPVPAVPVVKYTSATAPALPAREVLQALDTEEVALPGRFYGRIWQPDGNPLAGASLRVSLSRPSRDTPPDAPFEASAKLDAEGRFSLALDFGGYQAVVEQGELRAETDFSLHPAVPAFGWDAMASPTARIAGRVVDWQGQPSGEVTVVLWPHPRDGLALPRRQFHPAEETVSDASGRFAFSIASGGPDLWEAAALMSGAVAITSPPLSPGTEDVLLRLPPPFTLAGVVVDAETEVPLPGVALAVEGRPYLVGPLPVVSGDDGAFEIAGLPQGEFVIALAESDKILGGDTLVEARGMPRVDVKLLVSEGSVLEGTVLDAAGNPLPQLVVRADEREARVSEAGDYRLTGFGPGEAHLYVLHAGQRLTTATVMFAEPPQVLRHDFVIDCASVSGRVVDTEGAPVAGAQVTLSTSSSLGSTVSGEDGSFSLACLTGTELRRVHARAGELDSGQIGPFPLEGSITGLELVLHHAWDGMVSGHVVDQHGQPLPGASVRLMSPERAAPRFSISTITQGDGTFSVLAATPATYGIMVEAYHAGIGKVGLTNLPEPLHLARGEARSGLLLVCEVEAGVLRGTVVDETGLPVAGAQISVIGQTFSHTENRVDAIVSALKTNPASSSGKAISRQDGSFVIGSLKEDLYYQLTARHPSFKPVRLVDIFAQGEELQVVLPPADKARLKVVDARTRQPITYFNVSLLKSSGDVLVGPLRAASKEGEYILTIPLEDSPIPITLEVMSTGYERHTQVLAQDAGPMVDYTIALNSTDSALPIRVVSPVGMPIGGAQLYLDEPPGRGIGSPDGTTDGKGEFTLFVDGPDARAVYATAPDFLPGMATAAPGGTHTDITLPFAGTLSGHVIKNGQPVAYARLWLDTSEESTVSQPDGSFTWEVVPAGPAIISVQEKEAAEAAGTFPVEVLPQTITDVTLELP